MSEGVRERSEGVREWRVREKWWSKMIVGQIE